MLFANFRSKARTLLTMKVAEWKSDDQIVENAEILERFQHVEKEAEYEIKQHIVDAVCTNKEKLLGKTWLAGHNSIRAGHI